MGSIIVSLICTNFYADKIVSYTEKGLLKLGNIPQIFNFLIQEIKAEQGDIFVNNISFDEESRISDLKNQKHIFVFDRTGSQIKTQNLDDTEKELRKEIANELRNDCNKSNNSNQNITFINNLKYGELIFLYTIIATYKNADTITLPINLIHYLGHNQRQLDIKYLNNRIENSEKCSVLDSCLSYYKKYHPQDNHNSYYSTLLEDVYSKSIKKSEGNTVLTIVGDFASEESMPNSVRYDKNGKSLEKILEEVYKVGAIKEIRVVVLPLDKNTDREKSIKTIDKFHFVLEEKLKIIHIDSTNGDLPKILEELKNTLKVKTVVARYKKKETKAISILYIKEGEGNTFTFTNFCKSAIEIHDGQDSTRILPKGTSEMKLKSGTIRIECKVSDIQKLRISRNGESIPLDIDFVEFFPKYIALIVLSTLTLMFSLFFFNFLKDVYVPLYHKYHQKIKILGTQKSINISNIIAFWASTIGVIFLYSMFQSCQLYEENDLLIFSWLIFLMVIPPLCIFYKKIMNVFGF